jgi:8-oxo-dGTP pyrophosphatase MutT (NUDIX family)
MAPALFFFGIKALVHDPAGRALLLRVQAERAGNVYGRDYWDLPGGRVEEGESDLRAALCREVEEETGLQVVPGRLLGGCISPLLGSSEEYGRRGLLLWVYEASVAETKHVMLSAEHDAARWVSQHEALKLLSVKYPPQVLESLRASRR